MPDGESGRKERVVFSGTAMANGIIHGPDYAERGLGFYGICD